MAMALFSLRCHRVARVARVAVPLRSILPRGAQLATGDVWASRQGRWRLMKTIENMAMDQYLQIPTSTICRRTTIHSPTILMFTRGKGFDPSLHTYIFLIELSKTF